MTEAPIRSGVEPSKDVHYTTREVFYDLTGPGGADIARELDDYTRRNNGRVAETRWNLKTDLRFSAPDGGECHVSKMDIAVDLEIELPRWKGAARSPLRDRWEKFEAAARLHEQGHYDHGVAAGNEVAAVLRELKAESCDALGKLTASSTNAIVGKYTRIDEKYDADTRHGILQGIVWEYSE